MLVQSIPPNYVTNLRNNCVPSTRNLRKNYVPSTSVVQTETSDKTKDDQNLPKLKMELFGRQVYWWNFTQRNVSRGVAQQHLQAIILQFNGLWRSKPLFLERCWQIIIHLKMFFLNWMFCCSIFSCIINDYHPAPLIPALVHWAKQPPSGVNLSKIKSNA